MEFAAVVMLAGLAASSASAQRLVDGKPHPIREREIDIKSYRAELDLDLVKQRVKGRATIVLEPLREIDTVKLDAWNLDLGAARLVDDDTELAAISDGRTATVRLPEPRKPGESLTIELAWTATPRAGLYFQKDPATGSPVVFSYGEGGLHANWLPIYNDTNDRFSTEMIVTVPRDLTVISNGVLVGKTEKPGGLVSWDWRQDRPHANYLIAIYVGDFERGELPSTKSGVPLAYWVPRGRLDQGANVFANTTRMVEFFERRLDYPYPWVKYDQVAVPDYPLGAMEHTTVTGHDVSVLRSRTAVGSPLEPPLDFGLDLTEYSSNWKAEATIAHELGHHWFGDEVTCAGLSEIWLNESFATFLMLLWTEESQGRDQLLFELDQAQRYYQASVERDHLIRPLAWSRFDTPDDIYDSAHTYLKGAAVLHLLRRAIGDDKFFKALAGYLDRHAGTEVTSADFQAAAEAAAGESLEWFFADWVHGGGHPILEIEHRYLTDRKLLDVEIRQVQPLVEGQGWFRLPVTIAITDSAGTREERVWIDGDQKKFLFAVPEKPTRVVVDPWGDLIAELRHDLGASELAEQAARSPVPATLRALRQLAHDHQAAPETARAFAAALEPGRFWGIRAEAARLAHRLQSAGAAEPLLERGLGDPDYRVRKAAVLATADLALPSAADRLRSVVERDRNGDVVAAAIAALGGLDPAPDPAFLRAQLDRESWHDEVRIATLGALGDTGGSDVAAIAKGFTTDRYNENVRLAALRAWRSVAPNDPWLREALRERIAGAPASLQSWAVEAAGELADRGSVPPLEEISRFKFDPSLTWKARRALDEIRRFDMGPARRPRPQRLRTVSRNRRRRRTPWSPASA